MILVFFYPLRLVGFFLFEDNNDILDSKHKKVQFVKDLPFQFPPKSYQKDDVPWIPESELDET